MKKIKVGIWGWWQGHNLGDNWIRHTVEKSLPKAEWLELTFLNTFAMDFTDYDFIIVAGGGLFIHDVISPWSDRKKIKVPFGFFGLGAEFPHKTLQAKELAESARFFFVRDKYSIDCMKLEDANRSFDTTFIHPLHWRKLNELDLNKGYYVWRSGKELAADNRFGAYMQYEENDNQILHLIEDNFNCLICDDFQGERWNLEDSFQDSGFIISGRYHGIIAAIQMGIPFIAIDICPKIRALVQECDLEKYCLKKNELDRLPNLIRSARMDVVFVREKEWAFRARAAKKAKKDWETAKMSLFKATRVLRGIHYGSYWMKENDIVNVMGDDLAEITELIKVDCKIYDPKPSENVKSIEKKPNTVVTLLKHEAVMKDVVNFRPDFIVMNAGGLVFEDETFAWLRDRGIKTIGIELSDPDVFPHNGLLYASKYDYFYTNASYSLHNEYDRTKTNVHLLPFAASRKHHYYMPEVERVYDLVIVGHARADRIKVLNEISKHCNVGTYGNGWPNSLGNVTGRAHVMAINSGRMYLSFAQTVAGFKNVKVGLFEAMACNQVVLTSYMDELTNYFEPGKEILCYHDTIDLVDLIKYYLSHEDELESIRKAGYRRFLKEHTYEKRWETVIKGAFGHEFLCEENKYYD